MALPFTNIDLLPDFARSTRLKNAKPAPKLPGTSIAAETFDKFGAPRKVALTLEAANQEQAAAVGRLKSRLILQVPATPINNTLTVDAIITNHYGTPQKSIALPETTNQQQTAADKFGALKKVVTKTDSTKESQAEVDSYGNIQKNLTTPDTIKQDQAIINRLNAQVSEQLKTEVVNQEQAALDRLNSRVMIPKDKILQTHEDHQVIGYGAPPPGPIVYKFTNGTPPNGTQCSYYNGVSTGFQLSTTLPGSIYSGVVPDGLVLTNTGAITGIPCTKGSQPFIVTATLSGNSTTMDYTTEFNPNNSLSYLLDKTARAQLCHLQNIFTKANHDITVEQWMILLLLWKENGQFQQQLADVMCKDKTTLTRQIDGLGGALY